MKYSTTTASLLLLSTILVLLLLYFGKLTRQIEKDNDIKISKINNLKELIKINELEYALHTNTDYLLKLKRIYFADNDEDEPIFNYIDLNDFKKKNIHQVFKASTK
jgi:hypothetical protein